MIRNINLIKNIFKTYIGKRHKFKVLKNIFFLQIRKKLLKRNTLFKTCTNTKALVQVGIDNGSISGMYYCGILEVPEVLFAWHLLRENDIFFDIGANQGSWGLILCAKGAYCHEFEPSSETFRQLEKQRSHNKDYANKFIPHKLAVSNLDGFADFTIGKGQANSLKSSINEQFFEQKYEQVETNTLDTVAEKYGFPKVIKIDTEGFELQVLQKGNNVLSNPNLKALIIETFRDYNSETKELIAFEKILASYNFYPYFYDPLNRSIEAITKPYEGALNTIYFRVNRENLVLLKESIPIKLFGKCY